jgi:RNA polymerase sigma factor (sigma-70 family)
MSGPPADETAGLLRRLHAGDERALQSLVAGNVDWVRAHVHRRLGRQLHRLEETDDVVQAAMVEVLRFGPRFVVGSEHGFRALMTRIVTNVLSDRHHWFHAGKRAVGRERQLGDPVVELDPAASVTRPSEAAVRNEEAAWIALALELLEPDDRQVIRLREWDGLSFAAIAERMGTSEDGARMRFNRALPRLAQGLEALRRGELPVE